MILDLFLEMSKLCECSFCQSVICRASSIKRHFKLKHKKSFKDDAEKIELLKKVESRYEKQSGIFKKVTCRKNRTIEGSYNVAEDIAKHGKPFTDGLLVKEAFLSCAEVLFDDLLNECALISRTKNMPVFPRRVERRITDIATDVIEQQIAALKAANVFSVAL